jgi:hypothetical protein
MILQNFSYVPASTLPVRIKRALKEHKHSTVLSFKLDLILVHIYSLTRNIYFFFRAQQSVK